ncbi:peroxide stress protein YaaA [Shewanella algae]|uniref:peroxide stress protein YaaA n=1 Tax=Shewanella algae TaxID=38313 RepID=UPI001AACC592|nr:peroxide stress protein YaaA [Shewanella algae]MBO2676052.1 peroxide stress protein YaaA [Shewanella algae]
MLILVSPAKTLDYDNPAAVSEYSLPQFLEHSSELIQVCRDLTPANIASLMKVSDKIAGLNAARFAEWQPDFTPENAKQALYAFRGDVYTGLDADSLAPETVARAQQHLRILSGLYGLLRPLDLMQAYRLEMGTSLANPRGNNLYAFWGNIITDAINQALAQQGDDIVVNLASNEYFKAVKPKQVEGRIITPVFKDCKKGQYKVISFYAKKARGMMARYLLEQEEQSLERLRAFNSAGYYYSETESSTDTPVFLREEQS